MRFLLDTWYRGPTISLRFRGRSTTTVRRVLGMLECCTPYLMHHIAHYYVPSSARTPRLPSLEAPAPASNGRPGPVGCSHRTSEHVTIEVGMVSVQSISSHDTCNSSINIVSLRSSSALLHGSSSLMQPSTTSSTFSFFFDFF